MFFDLVIRACSKGQRILNGGPVRICAISALLGLIALGSAQGLCSDESTMPVPNPFIGERLVFTVKWDPPWYLFFLPKMEAGEFEVWMTGVSEFKNKPMLKTIIKVQTSGKLVSLTGFKVEDEFELYSDPDTLCAGGAIEKIREGKKKRQRETEYLRESRQLHFRDVDEAVAPPKLVKDIFKDNAPACVRDAISAFYLFRTEKLQPGFLRKYAIYNYDRISEASAQVEKREIIDTPAGKIDAWRMQTDVMKGKLYREKGQLKIWLSVDEKHLPVQFEAKVGMGRMFGVLKSTGKN
jgi:hypothetical protein